MCESARRHYLAHPTARSAYPNSKPIAVNLKMPGSVRVRLQELGVQGFKGTGFKDTGFKGTGFKGTGF